MIPGNCDSLTTSRIRIGHPAWLALLGVLSVNAWATIRRYSSASFWLTGSLLALVVLNSDGRLCTRFQDIQSWPLAVIAVLPLFDPHSVVTSSRLTSSAAWLAIPVGKLGAEVQSWLSTPVDDPTVFILLLAIHWMLIACGMFAFCFRDSFARQLRWWFMVALPVFALAAVVLDMGFDFGIAPWMLVAYGIALAGCSLVAFGISRFWLYALNASLTLLIAIVPMVRLMSGFVDSNYRSLATFGLLAVSCFAIGVGVSCIKAGLANQLSGIAGRLKQEWNWHFQSAPAMPPVEHA